MKRKPNQLLVIGVLCTIIGVVSLVLSNYMQTSVTFSTAQTNRAHVVDYIGRGFLVLGLILIIILLSTFAWKQFIRSSE
jgi:hypothetical protein